MNAKHVFGLLVLIIGLALCGIGLWMLFSPPEYEAVVEIEVEQDVEPGVYQPYDPYFIETELKTMQGNIVLSNVVQTLNLDVKWTKQYRKQLRVGETIELLGRRMNIDGDRQTKIIQIGVWDRDPDEAAQIANAIAEAYRSYRLDRYKQLLKANIESLENEHPKDEKLQEELKEQIQYLKSVNRPPDPPVVVIAPAIAPKVSATPNRWQGGVRLLSGLLLMCLGFCLLRNGVKVARIGL